MLRYRQLNAAALLIVFLSAGVNTSTFIEDGNDTSWNQQSDFGDSEWFVSPPLLPISLAASSYIRDAKCKGHSRLFLQQLRNFTLWAVQ
ncbi:hypothetical protein L9F63_013349, partial [Diploptera punctata]